jgi:hypothetical protein
MYALFSFHLYLQRSAYLWASYCNEFTFVSDTVCDHLYQKNMELCNKDLRNVVIQWNTCLYICSAYLKAHKSVVNVYWAIYIMEIYIVNVTMLLLLLLLFTETIFLSTDRNLHIQ